MKTAASDTTGIVNEQHPLPPSLARTFVHNSFANISRGQLAVSEGAQINHYGEGEEVIKLTITDHRTYECLLLGGATGAAEAYISGYWQTSDLTGLLRLLLRNRRTIEAINGRLAFLRRLQDRLYHFRHRDTISGSRRNIAAHYDLSNDFFNLFLDPTMMYSSGYFHHQSDTMADASRQKIDLICRKMELTPGDRVIEIGTGWGGFALHAAMSYDCDVTTTTISDAQYQYVRGLVEREGLEHKVTVLKQDYRQLTGTFDKLVSIEMIEAVGLSNLPLFFSTCSGLLKDHGRMLLQAITIADQRYEAARQSVDFIQRYIFPGGALPSVTALAETSSTSSDLRIHGLEDITWHYAKTINRWSDSFKENLTEVKKMGFTEEFIRTWRYYLSYCEAGFRERAIGCIQLQLHKPGFRQSSAP